MRPFQKPSDEDSRRHGALLRAVPRTARQILDVGCGDGRLGAALKAAAPGRQVVGIESEASRVAQAVEHLDQVFHLDPESAMPSLEPGSLDCIIYGSVLDQAHDPEAILSRYRSLLAKNGIILCCLFNIQHHAFLTGLCKASFPPMGPGDSHRRFVTYTTALKMLLDCGFGASLVDTISQPPDADWYQAAGPLLRHLGLHEQRTHRYLSATHFIIEGRPLPYPPELLPAATQGRPKASQERPLSFVACVSNEQTLHDNLLSSRCFGADSPHELLLFRDCQSAAEGLNAGLTRARHDLVVCVHQDVYLPEGWPQWLWRQYTMATEMFGPVGVLGVFGTACEDGRPRHAGHVLDRDRMLAVGTLPSRVDTLDEVLVAIPRGTPLRFDPELGFHLYAADLCLSAKQHGLAAVAIDAPCFHNSLLVDLPPSFAPSAARFAAKWTDHLPVATPSIYIEKDGRLRAPL
jgi:SAM-dependent methyltransferase